MEKYLSFIYWFNSRPEPLAGRSMDILLGIIVILFILGVAGNAGILRKFNINRKKELKIISFVYTNAFIGLILAFLNYQIIPYLRARFIYIIWFLITVIWLWKIIKPKRKLSPLISAKEQEIKKYLPH